MIYMVLYLTCRTYERLLRKLIQYSNRPAVILMQVGWGWDVLCVWGGGGSGGVDEAISREQLDFLTVPGC